MAEGEGKAYRALPPPPGEPVGEGEKGESRGCELDGKFGIEVGAADRRRWLGVLEPLLMDECDDEADADAEAEPEAMGGNSKVNAPAEDDRPDGFANAGADAVVVVAAADSPSIPLPILISSSAAAACFTSFSASATVKAIKSTGLSGFLCSPISLISLAAEGVSACSIADACIPVHGDSEE